MKVLFTLPFLYGYETEIKNQINTHFPHIELDIFHYDEFPFSRRKSRSFFEKIYYVFFEFYFRKKNKTIQKEIKQFNQLKSKDKKFTYDIYISLRPDYLKKDVLKFFALDISKKSIAYFSDSINASPDLVNTIPFFEKVYAFQEDDCAKYNLPFETNFYFEKNNSINPNPENKIFCFFLYDKHRIKKIIQIAESLKDLSFEKDIRIITRGIYVEDTNKSLGIKIQENPLTIDQVYNYTNNSKFLLEVQADHNKGLTYRCFEALFFKRKLITTNTEVKKYDFYNPINIFIWTPENPIPDKNFLESPYEDLPKKIYEKYNFKNWFKRITEI